MDNSRKAIYRMMNLSPAEILLIGQLSGNHTGRGAARVRGGRAGGDSVTRAATMRRLVLTCAAGWTLWVAGMVALCVALRIEP